MHEYLDVICERLVLFAPEYLDAAYTLMLRRGVSPSTVLEIHRLPSRALRIAVRRGQITRNVGALIDARRLPHTRSSL